MAKLEKALLAKRESEEQLEVLEKQVTQREQEILRLHHLYEGG